MSKASSGAGSMRSRRSGQKHRRTVLPALCEQKDIAEPPVRKDADRFREHLSEGFRRPLEAAWLMFLINFKVFLWSLLLIVPGIVAAYRYRQVWYVKAQHPDWSAAECIAQSSRLMDGCKWKAFVFDLSYIPWLLLAGVCAGMSILLGSAFAGALFMGAVLFVLCYFFAGRAAFYRNLVEERKAAQ